MKKKIRGTKQASHNKKQSAKSMFVKGLLQSFFIVAILLTTGLLGYQSTIKLWWIDGDDVVEAEEAKLSPEPITVASIDDISKNLIYCYDMKSHQIKKLVLEIYHCEKKQLTYITIPMSTQLTMSDTLYKKLILIHPATPQMIRLSAITKYFPDLTVFDYGVLMVEDMLDIDISYYTMIPEEIYNTMFTEQFIEQEVSAASIYTLEEQEGIESSVTQTGMQAQEIKITAEVFTKEYIEFLKTIETVEELSTYIEEVYQSLQSNLTVFDKMNYLESYSKTPLDKVTFERISGDEINVGFLLDERKASQRLRAITAYGNE